MRIALHPRDPIAVALAYVDKSTVVSMLDLSGKEPKAICEERLDRCLYYPSVTKDFWGCLYHEPPASFDSPAFFEMWDWKGKQREQTQFDHDCIWFQDMKFSPDGRLAAISSFGEATRIYTLPELKMIAHLEGGEYISGTAFDDSSSKVSAMHTFQGGGYISLHRIDGNEVEEGKEIRSDTFKKESLLYDFADTFASLAFLPENKGILAFATNSAAGDQGDGTFWQGELILFALDSNSPIWRTIIDSNLAKVVGETEAIPTTFITLCAAGELALVGTLDGSVLVIRTGDGSLADVIVSRAKGFVTQVLAGPSINGIAVVTNENEVVLIDCPSV